MSVDVIYYPGRGAAGALAPAGRRARQLRRPAPRPPEDRRARLPPGARARRHAGRADLRSASAARRPSRQGAAAADDHRAAHRGAASAKASRASPSSASPHELSRWEPEQFVRSVLVEWLHVAEVWVGGNFLFGRDRSGNFTMLRSLGARYGFRAEKIDPVRYRDFVVSSTRVRRLVVRGARRRGRARCSGTSTSSTAGSPAATAAGGRSAFRPRTSRPRTSCCRRTASTRRRSPSTAAVHRSITNIGVRPTFGARRAVRRSRPTSSASTATSTIRSVRLAFVQRMRGERAFPDVAALVAQIEADCRQARELFDRLSPCGAAWRGSSERPSADRRWSLALSRASASRKPGAGSILDRIPRHVGFVAAILPVTAPLPSRCRAIRGSSRPFDR